MTMKERKKNLCAFFIHSVWFYTLKGTFFSLIYVCTFILFILVIDSNEIQANANNHLDNGDDDLTSTNQTSAVEQSLPARSPMIFLPDSMPSFVSQHGERTISSSSSEQLIPKEKQTGKTNKL